MSMVCVGCGKPFEWGGPFHECEVPLKERLRLKALADYPPVTQEEQEAYDKIIADAVTNIIANSPPDPIAQAIDTAAYEAIERVDRILARAMFGTDEAPHSTETLAAMVAGELAFFRTRKSYAELAEHWDRLEDRKKAMK